MISIRSGAFYQPTTESSKTPRGEWFNPFAFFIFSPRKICYPENPFIQYILIQTVISQESARKNRRTVSYYNTTEERKTVDNDNALISRAQTGDEGAFAEMMRAHYAFVYAIVIGIVNNPNDAEEVVQEIFLNAYRSLPQLEDTRRFKGWLAKIARNRALNWLREQRIDTVSINEVSEDTLQTADSPDEQLIRNEQRELIRRAMETLPQKDRDIARSYYLEGASYDELIRAHGLSYKAISFRLSRAKQKLAKRLSHLLTGVFAIPASSLKQIYSGGLTVMKVGTVPKITAGAVAIILLVFIGTRQFISSKEDSSPPVEVVTSTPDESTNSVAQGNATRKEVVAATSREDKPQISTKEMGQIEDFFAQLEGADAQSEADTSQLATDEASNQDSESGNTNSSVASEGTGLSAEEVMNAYVEALKNVDFEAILPFVTGAARDRIETSLRFLGGEFPEELVNETLNAIEDNLPEGVPEALAEKTRESVIQSILKGLDASQTPEGQAKMREGYSQIEIVSSEYVGDEFHFRLEAPTSDSPRNTGLVLKMRKVAGEWRIYDGKGNLLMDELFVEERVIY